MIITMVRRISQMFKEHFHLVMLLVSCLILYMNHVEPTEDIPIRLISLIKKYGLVAIILPQLTYSLFNLNLRKIELSLELKQIGFKFVYGLTCYVLIIWLVGQMGDASYRFWQEDPENFIIFAILFVILVFLFKSSKPNVNETMVPEHYLHQKTKITEKDKIRIAAHEAGHAICYAALSDLPKKVHVSINKEMAADGALGYVIGIYDENSLNDRVLTEWQMHVSLAGKVAEDKILNESSLGSSGDYERWIYIAKRYLSSDDKSIYYPNPVNEFEYQSNNNLLFELREQQINEMGIFIDKNIDLIKEISAFLNKKGHISNIELAQLLKQVDVPENFPKPKVEAEI